jgi:pimeloyl-ACP methyl ester carboxylesterase
LLCVLPSGIAEASSARLDFVPCGGAVCGSVSVPLDRSGAYARQQLHLHMVATHLPMGKVVFLIAGGPGQSASHYFHVGHPVPAIGALLPNYTPVAIDLRGTGKSGALRCRSSSVRGCASELGLSRRFYRLRDDVQDLEAVRQAIGVRRIALAGSSWGNALVIAYARTYPKHVDRIVLDSPARPGGDRFSTLRLRAMPRVIRTLCSQSRCGVPGSKVSEDLVSESASMRNR